MSRDRAPFLPGYALFGAFLACAGLPIYIHAPKFFTDTYGVGLGLLGAVLLGLRALDMVQEPLLGWLADRVRARGAWVLGAAMAMVLAMAGLFVLPAPVGPVLWFAVTLTALFSAYSFLTILFYGTGVVTAERLGAGGHVRLAAWRESGTLVGVCLAAAAPTVFGLWIGAPFAGLTAGVAVLGLAALWAMRGGWAAPVAAEPVPLRAVLSDPICQRLLGVALLNAAPVAVTSTLFLFFVESRLAVAGWEGALLILFFLAAACAAPLWARLAARFGAKPVLLAGMTLSVIAFAATLALGAGDLGLFALVCLASGAALGADMTLLPALFAARLARVARGSVGGFGLWAFASKFTLALAAGVVLPLLERSGFTPGAQNSQEALWALTLLYAALPLVLKTLAIGLLIATPIEET